MEKIIKNTEVHLTLVVFHTYFPKIYIIQPGVKPSQRYIYIYIIQPGVKPVHPLFVFVVVCIVGDYWEFSQRKTSSVT